MVFNSNFVSTPSNKLLDINNLRWNHNEKNQTHRNQFAKDRDRILYSKSFLRLRGKTQIFMIPKNDYIRTRLTHTLEVNQLAKSIASALGQNLDLVEAIALGHDVGHTPFGHVGERKLAEIIEEDGQTFSNMKKGFKHNLQALRLFCDLEKGADYPHFNGLNLTKYTLWGIAHHSSIPVKDVNGEQVLKHPVYKGYLNEIKNYWSFEGYIVALADEIAQRHHDIEDGLRYGMISRSDLLGQIETFQQLFHLSERNCLKRLRDEANLLEESVFNSLFSRLVINMYVTDAVKNTKTNLRQFIMNNNITKQEDFQHMKLNLAENEYKDCVALSSKLKSYDKNFHNFLKSSILQSYQAQALDGKAAYIIRKLYKAFVETPSLLPDATIKSYARFLGLQTNQRGEILKDIENARGSMDKDKLCEFYRCIVDYIGGMTDQFAYDEFDRLYGSKF